MARVADRQITQVDLQRELIRRTGEDGGRAPRERRRQVLEDMLGLELLAEEAERRGYDRDPELVRSWKQLLAARVLREEIDPQIQPSDQELTAYYESHRSEFVKPEEVRLRQIVVKDARQARRVAALAQGLRHSDSQADERGFSGLVAEHSQDPASRVRQGDLGFHQSTSPHVPAPILRAGFSLTKLGVGAVSDPIAHGSSFHILKLAAHRPAVVQTLESVRSQIRDRLMQQRRRKAVDTFMAALRERYGPVIEDKPRE